MAIDAHLHLDKYDPSEREEMLARSFAAGICGVVCVSVDAESCLANEELARRDPLRIVPAYGHHPEQPPLGGDELETLCRYIKGRPTRERFAIGEVGLPYFLRKEAEASGRLFDLEPYVRQLERFARLAAELDRPIALHAVWEDADAAMDLLERYGVRRAHFHWFKGGFRTVERLIRNGYFISVTPEALYEPESRELAMSYPLELLMVETDGPWPFEGPFAGKRTEPWMVNDTVKEIAALRGMSEEIVETVVEANTRRFYGWPPRE